MESVTSENITPQHLPVVAVAVAVSVAVPTIPAAKGLRQNTDELEGDLALLEAPSVLGVEDYVFHHLGASVDL
eukprot:900232-Amorphochlora_amoeboformis.AAC.1